MSNKENNNQVNDEYELPNTATNIYNLILLGIVLLLIGTIIMWRNRKMEN
ncbi:LPXTG cell wall anchor domain-containing protein [Bacillus sp. JCM 19034]